MKNIFGKLVLMAFLFTSVSGVAVARECTTCKKSNTPPAIRTKAAAVCKRAQSTAELNVNNVRALINGYGNMWYDGSVAQYHLPKTDNTSPLFCAALWIGGTDVNNQLRLAALRFGSDGDDYWPGPLELQTAAVDLPVCNDYDKHWIITKAEVQALMAHFRYDSTGVEQLSDPSEDMTDVIKSWPWQGSGSQSAYLAPFYDANNNGRYDPENGDYPYYDFENVLCPRTIKANLPKGEKYVNQPTMEETRQNNVISNSVLPDQVLKGDQTIWWIFNDMGNTHTETKGQPIGLEIRAQAFAFATNNAINDMTFYSYEIINRSTYELRETYFSQWVDPDLGYAFDDYVGCDVKRGLGYCYNGDDNDGPGSGSYSGIPPAVGIDFFQGPYMDPDHADNPKIDIPYILTNAKASPQVKELLVNYKMKKKLGGQDSVDALGRQVYDTIGITDDAELFYIADKDSWYNPHNHPGDEFGNCAINGVNFGNGIVDDERFGMRRFVYYDNSSNNTNGEPNKAKDYYNYLRGYWKNGSRMKFGGDAISQGTTTLDCDFMFPGDSDPWDWGTNGVKPQENGFTEEVWTEVTAGNTPNDRRFMQSAGPFTLKPGAVNYITVGIPYAQASTGNSWTSVEELRQVDDICQALFDNCFKVLDGPDAPTLVAQELSNEVILYITYDNKTSNNYKDGKMESYSEFDPSIPSSYIDTAGNPQPYSDDDRSYKFEGYQIYQLADANASISDIEKGDISKARLVAQCDIENYYDTVNNSSPIATLVNYNVNTQTGLIEPQIMVSGSNSGIRHVFRVTTDQFASGTSTALVNNKEYYFIAIAYAHNCYKKYSQTEAANLDGQKNPYLAGRKNENGGSIEPIKVIPHNPAVENAGTLAQAEFGTSPVITRISGYGNSGRTPLRLMQSSIDALMGTPGQPGMPAGVFNEDYRYNSQTNEWNDNSKMGTPCMIAEPKFEENFGPINVTVIDPLSVKPGKFQIKFWNEGVNNQGQSVNDYTKGVTNNTRWFIVNADGGPIYYKDSAGVKVPVYESWADFSIGRYNEQLFLDLGISVALSNPVAVSSQLNDSNSYYKYVMSGGVTNANVLLKSSMTYADENLQWLSAVPDNDSYRWQNWIRAGGQYTISNISSFIGSNATVDVMSEDYLDDDYFRAETDPKYNHSRNYPPVSWGVDPSQQFEGVVNGTWAPYGLASTLPFHPGFNLSYYIADQEVLDSLNAVFRGVKTYNYNEIRRGLMDNLRNKSLMFNDLSKLPSVRIVFTADTSKWTRCPVLEMCDDHTQSEGNARRFHLRNHKSVNKLGKTIDDMRAEGNGDTLGINSPSYISEYGMGWFPGYAIAVATGERLNIMFGEDSRFVQYNGRDMIWNPVSSVTEGVDNYIMGGRHYIYVMNATNQTFYDIKNNPITPKVAKFRTPSYDAGKWAVKMLSSLDRLMTYNDVAEVYSLSHGVVNSLQNSTAVIPVRDSVELLFASCAWVNMPFVTSRYVFKYPGHNAELNAGEDYFGRKWYNGIACDVTVDIDVNIPYNLYMSSNETRVNQIVSGAQIVNNNMPVFQFEMTGSDITLTERAAAKNAEQAYRDSLLAMINVVPNPYYSYSNYETASQLETKVRIVNLPTGFTDQGPAGCNITIYTVDGTLVRKFPTVPVNQTTYDWDLHNHNGIPIAGGMYFIHVSVPGIGERVIKWFGTMRPVDLNSFQF